MNPISLLLGLGVPPRFAKPLLIGVGCIGVLIILVAMVKLHDHHVLAEHQAKIEQQAKAANDQAASERAAETIAIKQDESEAHHDIAAQPDQPIAPTSHVRACRQLHNAGKHSSACP